VSQWPEDLSHHLAEPTGYSAGYAARLHPAFIDGGGYPNYSDAEEAYYGHAGGTGPEFEDGYDDASGDLPHKIDQPEDYAAHHGGQADHKKRMRQMVNDQRQQEHNTLRSMGDFTVTDDFLPSRTPWNSTEHPEGSWEGCPTCNPRHEMASDDYTDPDDNIDPFDPRLIGAARQAQLSPEDADDGFWSSGHQSLPGDPTPEDYQRAKDWKNQLSDEHLNWFDGDDQSADEDFGNYLRDPANYVALPLPSRHVPHQDWDPDEHQDPFDPRLIGASRHHAVGENYGGSWHEEHYDKNGDYVGPPWPEDMTHHLHSDPVQAPYNAGYHAAWHPAFVNLDDPVGEARSAWTNAGGPTKEIEDFSTFEDGWEDALNGIPHMWLSPDAHQAYLEGDNDDLRKFNPKRRQDHADAVRNLGTSGSGWDPDDSQDPFDPRLIGAGLRRVGFDWKQTPEHELGWSNAKDQWWANLENGHQLGVWGNPGEGYTAALDLPFDPEDPDEPMGEDVGFRHPVREENSGRMTKFPTREHAQRGAEQEYKRLFPIGTDTGGHRSEIDSGVDYEKLINPSHDLGDEDYGHIFGRLAAPGRDRMVISPRMQEILRQVRENPAPPRDPEEVARHNRELMKGNQIAQERASRKNLLQNLENEFHGWYAENGNEKLNWAGRGPLGNWHQIENFLKDRYPAAHKGITTGKEETGHLLDNGQLGPDGDYCPTCHGQGHHVLYTDRTCVSCGGTGKPDQPLAYETGPDAIARHGYDPKEIAAGMLLLHNRTHNLRSDMEQADNDRLSEIARMRSQMQPREAARRRELIASLDYADIIRLAGDGMSWEDTISHINQVLADGEPEEYNDGIEPVHSCDGCGIEPDDDHDVQHVQRGDSFLGAFCDSCVRNL
jgi:hypothetical protein